MTVKAKPDPGTFIPSALPKLSPVPVTGVYRSSDSDQTGIAVDTPEGPSTLGLKQAQFAVSGAPVISQAGPVSRPRANPASALDRLRKHETFYLKVDVLENRRIEGKNLNRFTVGGEMDPAISVVDLSTLLETRFNDGAQVKLSDTGKQLVQEIVTEVEGREEAVRSRWALAQQHQRKLEEYAEELKVRETQLGADPRVREAERQLAKLRAAHVRIKKEQAEERVDHLKKLATGDNLPDEFDADHFPEAEVLAEATIQRWFETLEDQEHLVSGDFTELARILKRVMQRLVMRVADRLKDSK